MLLIKKTTVYFFGLLNLVLFYLILIDPTRIWWVAVVLSLVLILLLKTLTHTKSSFREFINFLIPGWWLVLSSILFLLTLENIYLKYLVVIFVPLVVFFYLQLIFSYLFLPHKYQPFSLVYLIEYITWFIVFFSAVGIFALQINLNLSYLITAALISVLSCLLLWQNFEANKHEVKKNIYYLLIYFLLSFEISGLLCWWPSNYYLKGFLMALIYFLFINLVSQQLKQVWNKKKNTWYILIILLIIMAILVTARWL